MFAKFKIIYLQKWTDQFKSDAELQSAMAEWGEALSGLSGQQIKRALHACRKSMPWPPSIAEFLAMAGDTHKGAAYQLFRPALPKPRDAALARRELSAIRARLVV